MMSSYHFIHFVAAHLNLPFATLNPPLAAPSHHIWLRVSTKTKGVSSMAIKANSRDLEACYTANFADKLCIRSLNFHN